MSNITDKKILILDFGSQYTQLIARRVRELNVYCEIHPHDYSQEALDEYNPSGIILSGGPNSVFDPDSPQIAPYLLTKNTPLLGICYGMQAMVQSLGGLVEQSQNHEYGYAKVEVCGHSPLLEGIEDRVADGQVELDVWMSHGDKVVKIPDGYQVIAKTKDTAVCAIANSGKNHYAVQFHPEVTHTPQGMRILERFVVDICGCEKQWTAKNLVKEKIAAIQEQVGSEKVLLGLSGGVDSSVVAAMLHQAIGDQLTCIFVDNGLLRKEEAKEVEQVFSQHMQVKVIYVDAKKKFLTALKGVEDPEQKRKIIGKIFIDVFEQESKKLSNIAWLAQGTIYPDVIESARAKTGTAQVIKTHHNVGGLPETMSLKLLEPLRELFKDEVRLIGAELGLPAVLLSRHPFPGPGLGVRILGEVKEEYIPILQHADAIYLEEMRAHDLYHEVAQAFAVFLPVRSVGVKGDARSYDYVIALRAVVTTDFMTAHFAKLPYEFLEKVANRIMNEVSHVSRVTYDISSKPPSTIEWE